MILYDIIMIDNDINYTWFYYCISYYDRFLYSSQVFWFIQIPFWSTSWLHRAKRAVPKGHGRGLHAHAAGQIRVSDDGHLKGEARKGVPVLPWGTPKCQCHWIGLRENLNRKPMGFYHQIDRAFL